MEIKRNAKGFYQIYLGDGKRGGYQAQTLAEVSSALAHHFENKELGENTSCPLCRAIHTEMAAMARGKSWRTAGQLVG